MGSTRTRNYTGCPHTRATSVTTSRDTHRARQPRPEWQLPRGVTRGLWEYIQAPHIADDYDDYFAVNRLFEFDEQFVLSRFQRPGRVVDLGCGTGRLLLALAERGFSGLGVDLSRHMLDLVGEKAELAGHRIDCVQANLVELGGLADDCADYVVCMFSTLGMIAGRASRRRVMEHARRILKPGGLFTLHVHNLWYNLNDPQGRLWLLGQVLRRRSPEGLERGDKVFDYRGIRRVYLHAYRRRELVADLEVTGFRVRELLPLAPERDRVLQAPWFLGGFRANGWLVLCE